MSRETAVESIAAVQTCVEKLAQLFPDRVTCALARARDGARERRQRHLQEQTVIEFGTAHEVLFASVLPLEFEDRVRLAEFRWLARRRRDRRCCSLSRWPQSGGARFVGEVGNWIIKP